MSTTRRTFLAGSMAVLAERLTAHAQPASTVYRIGFVGPVTAQTASLAAFRHGLRDLGYVEGTNFVLDARFPESWPDGLGEIFTEMLARRPDVMVVVSTPTALAAKRATRTVPIVFASLFDPVGSGVVTSLARPEGNITGVAIGVGGSGLGGKWVELLKEVVPGIVHVAVLSNSANPANASSLREIKAATTALEMKLEIIDARNIDNLNRSLTTLGSRAQGLIVSNDPLFTTQRDRIIQFAMRRRLPAIYFFRSFAESGGLMAYGASSDEMYRRAAGYVDKVLKGAKPSDLPIEQPTRFELVINLGTAKALGLTIPPSLLLRADQVIE